MVSDLKKCQCRSHLLYFTMGKLYVLGSFDSAGTIPVHHIAMWDGSSWDSLGAGLSDMFSLDNSKLVFDSKGNLYAGANFDSA